MKRISLVLVSSLSWLFTPAQEDSTGSFQTSDTVTILAFEQLTRSGDSPVPVTRLSTAIQRFSSGISLVQGLNTVAGVRMEERSPGSYRLNIRGSSLRSPFGVRNVKIYWNGIPVTDPGGNTYFNQFAWNNFSGLEIFRGPAGSMYGAGTGGLLLLHTDLDRSLSGFTLEYLTGSYGMHSINGLARFGKKKWQSRVSFAHQQTNGYRVQSRLRRDNFSWTSVIQKPNYEGTLSFLFTDMYYGTPGGLTYSEFANNPKAARPASGGFPSAQEARASIRQQNGLAGFTNLFRLGSRFQNTTIVYGALALIRNPAIRNFEKRKEPSIGGRSVFSMENKNRIWNLRYIAGMEYQQGFFNTRVFVNRGGAPDTLRTNDDVNNRTMSLFIQAQASASSGWQVLSGISITRTFVAITRLNEFPVIARERNYRNEAAPRISIMKKWGQSFRFSASVSRGFSPPTVSEVLPSTGEISTNLEAEHGWNLESTLRGYLFGSRLTVELTGFRFGLRDALVQQRDTSGADYFVNAGQVNQRGLELRGQYRQPFYGTFTRNITINADFTGYYFRYGSYFRGNNDFSGNRVPSIPGRSLSLIAAWQSRPGLSLNGSYYTQSTMFLNDANVARAGPVHLLGIRAGWEIKIRRADRISVFAGAENLLNQTHSIGYDINAAAGRYYNAAPARNFYAGLTWQRIRSAHSP